MFQPFEIFKFPYIQRLQVLNKVFLVTQTYTRAFDHFGNNKKWDILLSDYDDIGLAKIHLAAIRNDAFASVIDLRNTNHIAKLGEMLGPDSAYRLFWNTVYKNSFVKKRIDIKYKEHIVRYIEKNTNWKIGRAETIKPELRVVFGELKIVLKRNVASSEIIEVAFSEIEKS